MKKILSVLCIVLLVGCSAKPEEAASVTSSPETVMEDPVQGTEEPAAEEEELQELLEIIYEVAPETSFAEEARLADGYYLVEGQECRYVGFGEIIDGEFEPLRIFAVPEDRQTVYEYHNLDGYWYEQVSDVVRFSEDELRYFLRSSMSLGGFVYLGEMDFGESAEQFLSEREILPFLPFLTEVPVVQGEGRKAWLVVPQDIEGSSAVNVLDEEGNVKEVLYRSEEGDPVVIIADGDIQAVLVGEGGTGSFLLEDTFTNVYDEENNSELINLVFLQVQDPGPLSLDAIYNVEGMPQLIHAGLSMEEDNMVQGLVNLYQCYVIRFGTYQPDGYFTAEKWFALSNDGKHMFEYDIVNDVWNEIERVD